MITLIVLALIIKIDIRTGIKTINKKNVIKQQSIIKDNGSLKLFLCPFDDCEAVLYNSIINAHSIECAFYNLNNNKIEQALGLINPKNVWLVIDCSNIKEQHYKITPNIKCVRHYKAIMHDKFCVLDNHTVITGSFNPSKSLTRDYNSLLVINSSSITRLYDQEFRELYYNKKNEKSDYNLINLSGILLEVYFCPEDNCQQALINAINSVNQSAQNQSIKFMTYLFTDKTIAMQLIAISDNARVQGIMESQQISKYSVLNLLKSFNITVFIEESPRLMHHKTFIINDEIATIGSYNPTISGAFKNDENMVIIHNKNISEKLLKTFENISRAIRTKKD